MIRFKATTIAVSLKNIAKIYKDKIWKIYEILKKILSNKGPQFASQFIEDLSKALGIRRTLSMAYHPQIDSQTERINQEVKVSL